MGRIAGPGVCLQRAAPACYKSVMRLDPATSLLCVIDVQQRLLAAMPDAERVVARSRRLAEAAGLLGVKRLLTEQYPRGLGPKIGRAHV